MSIRFDNLTELTFEVMPTSILCVTAWRVSMIIITIALLFIPSRHVLLVLLIILYCIFYLLRGTVISCVEYNFYNSQLPRDITYIGYNTVSIETTLFYLLYSNSLSRFAASCPGNCLFSTIWCGPAALCAPALRDQTLFWMITLQTIDASCCFLLELLVLLVYRSLRFNPI